MVRTSESLLLPKFERTDLLGGLTEFVAAIRENREPGSRGRNNIGSLALTYAAVNSARTRKPVHPTGRTSELALSPG